MDDLIGKWGWVSVDEINSSNFKKYIHPKTLLIIEANRLSDSVFKCISVLTDNYLKLKSTEIELILKKEVFRLIPVEPKFKPLEKVKFLNSKGFLEFGVIKSISWHNKENKPIYFIEVNGNVKTKRYSSEDLNHYE